MTADSHTVIRAFELPVQAVQLAGAGDGWQLLRECWGEATTLANWGVQQLLRADAVRLPGMDLRDFPKPPGVDLYALAFGRAGEKPRKRRRNKETGDLEAVGGPPLPRVAPQYDGAPFFAGACNSASTILNGVRRKYVAERINVLWHRNKAPCTYRHPQPWPVGGKLWHAAGFGGPGEHAHAGKPYVICALPGGRVKLWLRGGPEFGRQMAQFREVVAGDLPRLQLVIRQQGSSNGCHRPTVEDGGRPCRVMVKMVAEVPVRERPGDRTLVLLTDPNAFWVAELDGRRPWILNADYVKRLVLHDEHLRWLRRVSEDGKAERRMGSNRYQKAMRRLGRASEKDRNRLASWTHETAEQLAAYAEKQKVAEVFYLDRDRGYVRDRFPWHELHAKLAQKLERAGIALHLESAGCPPRDEGAGGPVLSVGGDRPTDRQEYERWVEIRLQRLRAALSKTAAIRRVAAARKRPGSHPKVTSPSAKC